MTRTFGEAKNTNIYLENRYGKIYDLTFDGDKKLQKSIILDHDKDELKRMLKNTEAAINVAKDTEALYIQPYSIILVMITVIMSVGMTMISTLTSLLSNIFGRYLDSKNSKDIDFSQLFDSMAGFKPVMQYALWIAIVPFIVLIIFWLVTSKRTKANVEKRYTVFVLLNECLENYDYEKKQQAKLESKKDDNRV
ncbi:hypothetical protein MH138_07890 [Bacillus safensis]|uniref:hypothetical protein n=1 Tax=Bacillus safensis TaxID=561879 RepID=UPI002281B753|nr:hypothetical protein [Bacillus safensis]MCY7584602.1 hypothetical protein [Bacillus safensis]MCY7587473.1 hypothetical protein [Bacillus safensis]